MRKQNLKENTFIQHTKNQTIGIKGKSNTVNTESLEKISHLEKFIGHVKKYPQQYKFLVLFIALTVPSATIKSWALTSNIQACASVYSFMMSLGKNFCIAGFGLECLKTFTNNSSK